MGMGYGANYVDVIDHKVVKSICPRELDDLNKIIARDEEIDDINAMAQFINWGDDIPDEMEKAYQKLCKAFEKATGLTLSIGFHDSNDQGDRYDDVNGMYWDIGNAYEMTPQAKKFEKAGNKIQRKYFVTFG